MRIFRFAAIPVLARCRFPFRFAFAESYVRLEHACSPLGRRTSATATEQMYYTYARTAQHSIAADKLAAIKSQDRILVVRVRASVYVNRSAHARTRMRNSRALTRAYLMRTHRDFLAIASARACAVIGDGNATACACSRICAWTGARMQGRS